MKIIKIIVLLAILVGFIMLIYSNVKLINENKHLKKENKLLEDKMLTLQEKVNTNDLKFKLSSLKTLIASKKMISPENIYRIIRKIHSGDNTNKISIIYGKDYEKISLLLDSISDSYCDYESKISPRNAKLTDLKNKFSSLSEQMCIIDNAEYYQSSFTILKKFEKPTGVYSVGEYYTERYVAKDINTFETVIIDAQKKDDAEFQNHSKSDLLLMKIDNYIATVGNNDTSFTRYAYIPSNANPYTIRTLHNEVKNMLNEEEERFDKFKTKLIKDFNVEIEEDLNELYKLI